MKRLALILAILAAFLLGGCTAGIKPFPLTDEAISSLATSGGCLKVKDIVDAITEEHKAPVGTPLHNNLSKDWGIDSEQRYNVVMTQLNTLSLSDSCQAKAPAPVQPASASSSTTPSTTTSASAGATSTTSTLTLKSVYSWGGLLAYLDQTGGRQSFLDRINAAKDQLGFTSTDVEDWAKLNVECRVIVAFDDGLLDDSTINNLASQQVVVLPSGGIVHASSSVQEAGGPRTNFSGNDRVRVLLVPIKNGARTALSGVDLQDLNLLVIGK